MALVSDVKGSLCYTTDVVRSTDGSEESPVASSDAALPSSLHFTVAYVKSFIFNCPEAQKG